MIPLHLTPARAYIKLNKYSSAHNKSMVVSNYQTAYRTSSQFCWILASERTNHENLNLIQFLPLFKFWNDASRGEFQGAQMELMYEHVFSCPLIFRNKQLDFQAYR